MERQPVTSGRSRVHFNASNDDEEAEPTVNVASFDPDPDSEVGADEAKSMTESVLEEEDGVSKDITEIKPPSSFYFDQQSDDSDEEDHRSPKDDEHIHRFLRFKSPSAPTSPQSTPLPSPGLFPEHRGSDIPLLELNGGRTPNQVESRRSSANTIVDSGSKKNRHSVDAADVFAQGEKKEADRLVRAHTKRSRPKEFLRRLSSGDILRSGASTPEDDEHAKHYTFNSGVLTNLLKLYNEQPQSSGNTPPSMSGRTTPKWYSKSPNNSSTSLTALLAASTRAASAPGLAASETNSIHGSHHSRNLSAAFKPFQHKNKLDEQLRLTANRIADVLQRQRNLCRALMLYGSPSHRLEESLRATARALEIDAQFLYLPGCMVISFDDSNTKTSSMHLVRVNQGIDLGKLEEVHTLYKGVIHDVVGVEDAAKDLEEIVKKPPLYRLWVVVFMYGLASVCVGPFAFGARWIDIPIAFILGVVLALLQLVVAKRSMLYSNVFEISASIITSFLARAFGSIPPRGLFCFSSLTASSIALILPGYIVLMGSLELQSKNIVSGSVRMLYAVIYSLFLSFGITIGSSFYGWIDENAISEATCRGAISPWFRFIFVPGFTLCLLVINQARPKQFPVMILISGIGYTVTYFSSLHFAESQVASALGAFAIGVCGHLYSRFFHGLAFTASLPAVFVQVPSGLAAQAGIQIATTVANNTGSANDTMIQASSLSFGFQMIQISIAIAVGLFASALLVYPFARKRSGFFSF